jgi:phospholipid-binding lipoprotein MlaA
MTGCASVDNKDPLEGFNRGVYKFNDVSDKAVFKPIAGAYKAVMPTPVRSGVSNFFANLKTFVTTINQVLQFKFNKAAESAGRFVINSTVGIAGLFDVASKQGIPQYKEDFGQTLGYWGVGNGAYLMLPFFGPSTLRDTTGLIADSMTIDPIGYIDDPRTRNIVIGTKFIDTRAQLLPGSDLLDEAALDPYTFMRDAYLQRRANQVADGVVTINYNGFEPDNSAKTK